MIQRIFTVYDSKAEVYLPPFYFGAVGEAIRAFQDSARDEKHQFFRHAEDYTLFQIGEFDNLTCTFELLATPHSLGLALEFKSDEQLRTAQHG